MNQIQLAIKIDQVIQSGPNFFMKIDPEVIDFTKNEFIFRLEVMSKSDRLDLILDKDNYLEFLVLIGTAFAELKNPTIVCWNIKGLFTFILAKTGMDWVLNGRIVDLKIAESFVGLKDKPPMDFMEAMARIKKVVSDSSWAGFKNLYQKLYLPLITRVIPYIETASIVDFVERKVLFSFYEIEGQVNGRLACQVPYDNYFNPHSLSEAQKANLKCRDSDLTFMNFDYCHMEICMLAWLSRDERLNELVLEEDFYKSLFKLITGSECDTDNKRSFCKKLFLPFVYGQSARSLSEELNISLQNIEAALVKVRRLFPRVFEWVETYPSKDRIYEDYFTRRRSFSPSNEYKYRGFIVQAPSAMFCLEKLVRLHEAVNGHARIIMSVHDGYILQASAKQIETVKSMCLKVLESESSICPGLKVNTDCKISKVLS
jgi:hypothetical protein